MRNVFGVIAALALAPALPVSAQDSKPAELKAGDPAPEFELPGSDGKSYKLSDYKDKQAVVVAWYPRAFTGGCTRECLSLLKRGEQLRTFRAAVFAASCDPLEKNKEFAKSLGLDFPLLSDSDGSVAKKYGNYVPQHKAAKRWTVIVGKDGKILHIDKQVKVGDHGADVAAKLKELGVEAR